MADNGHLTYNMDLTQVKEALREGMDRTVETLLGSLREAAMDAVHQIESGRINVGDIERLLSVVGGAALTGYGLIRLGSTSGMLAAVGGAALLYRGLTGHCDIYESIGVDTHETPPPTRRKRPHTVFDSDLPQTVS